MSAVTEWQPIETAPKNVRLLLLMPDGRETWGDFDTDLGDGGMWTLENWSIGLGPNDAQPSGWKVPGQNDWRAWVLRR